MLKKINIIVALIISICAVTSLLFTLDNRWAKAERLEMVAMRLEQKIEKDRAFILQERIWKLDDRWSGREMPIEIKDEYRRLQKEMFEIINELERKRDLMYDKKKGEE